jgi:hypothetical protein
MFEYIEFYTKNLSNLTILLLIGAVIAILDITLRNVVKGVYLNVRDNIRLRHGSLDEIEGMENENTKKNTKTNTKKNTKKQSGGAEDSAGGGAGAGVGDENCPKDCNEVLALKKRLTDLVQNAANLQNDIKNNNAIIQRQHRIIAIMKQSVDKIVQKSNK